MEHLKQLAVLRAGMLTTVQDLGRVGWAHLGVPRSGAADRASLRLANRLVANQEGAAALEVTLGGLALQADGDVTIAVTGAPCPLTIDGTPAPSRAVLRLTAGSIVRFALAPVGLRAYLAVRGGVDVPAVLGSRSTDSLSGLGPAPIVDGDLLPVGSQTAGWPVLDVAPGADPPAGPVRLTAIIGPRDDVLADGGLDLLRHSSWRVGTHSDRVGLRLDGPPLPMRSSTAQGDRPSEGVVRGAIQLPPGGRPILFLADHPVTGGYPVVAVLIDAETDRAGQLRPGQRISFGLHSVTH